MKEYPAIDLAIAATVGVSAALFNCLTILLIPLLPVQLWRTLSISLAVWTSTTLCIQLPSETIEGTGHFTIREVIEEDNHLFSGNRYLGTLTHFEGFRNIPCTIRIPEKYNRPPANCDYLVTGTLTPIAPFRYSLDIDPNQPWIPLQSTHSLAEWRFHAKNWLVRKLEKHIHHRDSFQFLKGISTGSFDDPALQHDFSRFGLQHIMAISGFHFSLVAAFVLLLLRLILTQRLATLATLTLLTCYFLFLGPSPSILRAFFTLFFALVGQLFLRTSSSINILAFTVFILLIYDPLLITTIGFPFSVIVTASILLFYPQFNQQLKRLTPPRNYWQAQSQSIHEQLGQCLLFFLRESAALTLAVNVTALPLTLFYFGKFPALSLLYNLFFPFLVSLSMIFLLAALTLPFLENFLYTLNDHYTHFTLALTSNLPTHFDLNWHVTPLSSGALTLILILLFYAGLKKNFPSGNILTLLHGDRSSAG